MASRTTDDVLKLREAAKFLKLTSKAVLQLAADGRLPGRCIDGEWRFARSALLDWLSGRDGVPVGPAPPPAMAPETPEEQEAFLASIRAHRDEVNRATGHGKYAPE